MFNGARRVLGAFCLVGVTTFGLLGLPSRSLAAQIGVNYNWGLCWWGPCAGNWKSIGGGAKDGGGAPAVAPYVADNALFAFYPNVIGSMMFLRTWDGIVWDGPNSMGGQFVSDPGASTWGAYSTVVAAVGSDRHMYISRLLDGAFMKWEDLGGSFGPTKSGSYFRPVIVNSSRLRSADQTVLSVFDIDGSTGCLWVNVASDGVNFTGWQMVRCGVARDGDATLAQNRFAAFPISRTVHVFVRMDDGSLGHMTTGANGWEYESLGGYITSGPSAARSSSGYAATAFVESGLQKNIWVWERTQAKQGWTMLTSGKYAPPSMGSDGYYLKVFAAGSTGGIAQYLADGQTPGWAKGATLYKPMTGGTSDPTPYDSDSVPQPSFRAVFFKFQ